MIRIRIPGNLDVPTRFLGRFTPKDLARLGIPLLVAFLAQPALVWFVVAAVLGGVWYGIRPFGQPLDVHAYNLVRWLSVGKTVEGTDIEEEGADYVVTANGDAVGLIRVDPCNLEMKTDAEQGALHEIYRTALETASYPVEIHSRQEGFTLDGYIEELQERNGGRERLRDDYVEYCDKLSRNDLVTTTHYVVVRVEPGTVHWLADALGFRTGSGTDGNDVEAMTAELDSRCRELQEELNAADLHAERVNDDLSSAIQAFDSPKPHNSPRWNTRRDNDLGEYSRSVYLTELPASAELGWTLPILRASGTVDITQVVRPRSPAKTTKKLRRTVEKLNAEINSFLAAGYRGTNKLEALLDDAEWLLDLLADRQDHPFDYGVTVTVRHEEVGHCLRTLEQVKNRLETMQVAYEEPVFRTDQAFKTHSPLHPDALDETMLVPGRSAAAGFPFATQDTGREGVIHGVDTGDETPVFLDRFDWASHSMARMGTVGSGKSYAATVELLRASLTYDDLNIVVVDPKKEYAHIVRTLDGEVYTLGRDDYSFDHDVVSFEVEERGEDGNIDLLVDIVKEIYTHTSQDAERTLVLIDEARILMNDERGRRVLNQFVLEGRDTNTAITLVTQNASHFTHCRQGREILDNMPAKVFTKHERVPDSVIDYFDLSQREVQKLHELKSGTDASYGEALIKVSGRLDTRVRVDATASEHAAFEAGGPG